MYNPGRNVGELIVLKKTATGLSRRLSRGKRGGGYIVFNRDAARLSWTRGGRVTNCSQKIEKTVSKADGRGGAL